MKIPILTYHSMNIHGNDYGNNDHVALASDLAQLSLAGFRVAALHDIARCWLEAPHELEGKRLAAVTCDDGADFDFHDLPHPVAGVQRSMLHILGDFQRANPAAQPGLHITSFVIASPQARVQLDGACMIGKGWWNDNWWTEAIASGLMGIGNHSWDHNHECLRDERFPGVRRGSFEPIDYLEAADYQIRQANDYLRERAPNAAASLFAYPYGEANDFLIANYLPAHAPSMGLLAAFTTDPDYLTPRCDRWKLPRFMCGRDWRTPEELGTILSRASR